MQNEFNHVTYNEQHCNKLH